MVNSNPEASDMIFRFRLRKWHFAAYVTDNVINALPGAHATKNFEQLTNMAILSPDPRVSDGTDPGAEDNRLSLDPNNPDWKEAIADWEDGEEYTVTARVRQISPGEFEVIEVLPEEETDTEEEAEPMPMKGKGMMSGRVSKPVRDMMAET